MKWIDILKPTMKILKKCSLKKNKNVTVRTKENQAKKKMPQAEMALSDTGDVFQTATSWVDDHVAYTLVSRQRYRIAFLMAMSLCLALTLAVCGLIPAQHLEPLLINHYPDGRVSVQPLTQKNAPMNTHQVQSDLVRYVVNRESYSAADYRYQFHLMEWLSSDDVFQQYLKTQASDNPKSPVNALGQHGLQTVHVDSVLFIDKKSLNQPNQPHTHVNLAEVNFTVTQTKANSNTKTNAYTALIHWRYTGTPDNPEALWQNWDGFEVTSYRIQQRNVSS